MFQADAPLRYDGAMTNRRPGISGRIARKPMRWFLLIWLALVVLWLGVTWFTMDKSYTPIDEPDVKAIPYQPEIDQLIRSSANSANVERLKAIELPEYDPSAGRAPDIFRVWTKRGESELHAYAMYRISEGDGGWPIEIGIWFKKKEYDATDPTRLAPDWSEPDTETFQWRRFTIYYDYTDAARAIRGGAAIRIWLILYIAAGLYAASAILVFTVWLRYRLRLRRCRRRNLCISCRHQLDPAGIQHVCPECGADAIRMRLEDIDANRWWRRSGRLAFQATIAVMILWAGMSAVVVETMSSEVDLSKTFCAYRDGYVGYRRASWYEPTHVEQYGWPIPIISRRRMEPKRDENTQRREAVKHGLKDATFWPQGECEIVRTQSDPYRFDQMFIRIPHILTGIILIHLAALLLTGAVRFGGFIVNKRRALREPTGAQ
jgi:hypothetical protein